MRNTLLFAIVEEGKSDALMQVAKKAGSTGGTILTVRGTASSSLLCILGLGDSHKEILMTMVSDAVKDAVFKAIATTTMCMGCLLQCRPHGMERPLPHQRLQSGT
jgi:DNA-binding protein YbaB